MEHIFFDFLLKIQPNVPVTLLFSLLYTNYNNCSSKALASTKNYFTELLMSVPAWRQANRRHCVHQCLVLMVVYSLVNICFVLCWVYVKFPWCCSDSFLCKCDSGVSLSTDICIQILHMIRYFFSVKCLSKHWADIRANSIHRMLANFLSSQKFKFSLDILYTPNKIPYKYVASFVINE